MSSPRCGEDPATEDTEAAPIMSVAERFKNKEFMNWQRACQSLVMLKEFLQPFMDKKAKQLHEYVCARAGEIAVIACQKDHSGDKIQENFDDWWKRHELNLTPQTRQTQPEPVDQEDVLQDLEQSEAAAAPSHPASSPEPRSSTGDDATVSHSTPAAEQKR